MPLIGIPSLVAGLILKLAGSHWFTGAATVGTILIVVSIVYIVLMFLVVLAAASAVKR